MTGKQFHEHRIPGDYNPTRGDRDVFRRREDSPRSAYIVQVIHEVVGVPLKYFPLLAASEFAGALGIVLGIWWPCLGVAAGIGLVLYFVGAVVSHLRVGDLKGIGPAAFILPSRGGSTRPAHPHVQGSFCRIAVVTSPLHQQPPTG